MTSKVSITEVLREGWLALKKNANTVLALFVALQAIVFLLSNLLHLPILNILMIPVILLMHIAIFKSFKHPYTKFDYNEILSLKDPNLKPTLWKLFLTYLIYVVLLVLLLVLLVIPGIIFMVYVYLFTYIVIDQGLSGLDALKKSRDLIKGHWWKTFGLVVISAVLFMISSSIVNNILGGSSSLVGGFVESLVSGVISIYFGYVAVAYYLKLK